MNIFLIDDHKDFVDALADSIRNSFKDCKVTVAYDGKEALEKIRLLDTPPDLVITDYAMPRLSGIDLVKEIRIKNENVPILLITGCNTPIDTQPFTAVLMKPFRFSEVKTEVKRLLKIN